MKITLRDNPDMVLAYGRIARADKDFVTVIPTHEPGLQQPTLKSLSGVIHYGRSSVRVTEYTGRHKPPVSSDNTSAQSEVSLSNGASGSSDTTPES